MDSTAGNIFDALPGDVSQEVFEDILQSSTMRIERIVSRGHASPEVGWYDQKENEWVMILDGRAALQFEDGTEVLLKKGDYINIPAHVRHKVLWTEKDSLTVWLAVFYG